MPSLVGQRDLDLHRPRRRVDRRRGARHRAGERPAAQLRLRDDHLLPRPDELRVRLRHVDVDAQRIHLGQHEQRPAARIDQVADVDVAPRDDAGERRRDAREALQLAQPLDVGVGRGEVGRGLARAAAPLVELLLRDDVLLAQRFPALDRALRQRQARRRLLARRLRLRQLLVDLGRLDLGQQLALLDMAADVLGPALDVAGRARRQRRLLDALQRPRQGERLAGVVGLGDGRLDVRSARPRRRWRRAPWRWPSGRRSSGRRRPRAGRRRRRARCACRGRRARALAGSASARGVSGWGCGVVGHVSTFLQDRCRRVAVAPRRARRGGAPVARERRRRRPGRTAASTPSRAAARR